ncbi:MAG: ribose 5-phosphate isomerase A [Methyloprofundus sp.]|nr:MAG: ribose 5-phosphate isomerase A [Methyloprofundus sp.]
MNDKEIVATQAAKLVTDGMCIGLGTGSTADYFIAALAQRKKTENLNITTVASSIVSMQKAQTLDLPLVALEHLTRIDLYVDGADEVDPMYTLLKGQGADLVREKLLANASEQFIVLVDQSKIVQRIGERFAIPIEVMPFAWQMVKYQLEQMGAIGTLRQNSNGSGLAVSSYGSLILDMTFATHTDTQQLNAALNDIPGIVEHGIFYDLANVILLAKDGVLQELPRLTHG